jgi:3-hydroxyacyl-[acyl-carrier-protein] dehydratase
MAQIGVVAFGIYLLACQKKMRPSQMNIPLSLFSLADDVEFKGIVAPNERVIVKGKKNYFRKGVLKVDVTMERENGEIVCLGKLAGVGVDR